MNLKSYSFICGAIFLAVAMFHLLRILFGWDVMLAGVKIPTEVSWLGAALSAGLSIIGLGLSKSK